MATLNKKIFGLAFLFLFMFSFASAFNWSDSTSAYYKLDESSGIVIDSTGNYNGTNNGATPGVSGKINTAYDFEVTETDYISLPTITVGVDSSFTMNIWFKTEGSSASTRRLFNHNSAGSEFGFGVTPTNIDFFSNDGLGNTNYFNPANATYTDSTWTMATIVMDTTNDIKIIYVNGAEVARTTSAGFVTPASWTSVIGTKEGSVTTENFDGILDEFGIWARALSDEEILELYFSGDGLPYGAAFTEVTLEYPTNGTIISNNNIDLRASEIPSDGRTYVNATYYVWYNNGTLLNQTTISISNTTFNETVNIGGLTFGTYDWNVYVCSDIDCAWASSNSTFVVEKYAITSQEYSTEQISGTQTNFTLNIDLFPGYDITNAKFVYGGTELSPSILAVGDSRTISRNNYEVPSVIVDTNYTFYWSLTFSDSTVVNTSELTQLVTVAMFDNCSVYTNKIFNISLYDERTKLPILGDIEMVYSLLNYPDYESISDYTFSVTNVSSSEICSLTNISASNLAYSAEIRYVADDYAPELYNIQRSDIQEYVEDISLYDLSLNESTEFKVTYQDDSFNFVEGAILQLKRKYISEDIYEVVEAPLTSRDGIAVIHIDLDTRIYSAVITKNGEVLDTFDNIVFKCTNELSGDCEQKLLGAVNPQNSITIETINDFSYTIPTINDTDDVITATFSIPSNSVSLVNIIMKQRDQFGNETICNKTVTSSAGSIFCQFDRTIGDSYIDFKIYKDGILMAYQTYKIKESNSVDFLGNNYLIVVIMILSLVGMAITSPEWMVLISIIGLFLAGSLWLINGTSFVVGLGILMWLMLAAAIIIFKLSKQEDR